MDRYIWKTEMVAEETDSTEDHKKSIKRPALSVRMNVKYRSNLLKADLFIAEIVSQSGRDIKTNSDTTPNINKV
jgi:hypothetical protein